MKKLGWVLITANVICLIFVVLGMFANDGIFTWIGWNVLLVVFTTAIVILMRIYIENKNK